VLVVPFLTRRTCNTAPLKTTWSQRRSHSSAAHSPSDRISLSCRGHSPTLARPQLGLAHRQRLFGSQRGVLGYAASLKSPICKALAVVGAVVHQPVLRLAAGIEEPLRCHVCGHCGPSQYAACQKCSVDRNVASCH
jgi:hypothetical protein